MMYKWQKLTGFVFIVTILPPKLLTFVAHLLLPSNVGLEHFKEILL